MMARATYPFRLIVVALQFFTRVPIATSMKIDEGDMGHSTAVFPLAGAFVALVMAAVAYAMLYCGVAATITAAALLCTEALLTGAFHWDGLADTFDGIFSTHKGREEMLDIMHDSRVGVMGATSIALVALLQYSAISCALQYTAYVYAIALVSSYMLGKWSCVFLIVTERYGRKKGKGLAFFSSAFWLHLAIATALVAPLAIAETHVLAAFAGVAAFSMLWKRYTVSILGGVTGDTLGACARLSETVALVIICTLM